MKPGTLYSELPEHLRRYRADIFDDKYNRLAWDELRDRSLRTSRKTDTGTSTRSSTEH